MEEHLPVELRGVDWVKHLRNGKKNDGKKRKVRKLRPKDNPRESGNKGVSLPILRKLAFQCTSVGEQEQAKKTGNWESLKTDRGTGTATPGRNLTRKGGGKKNYVKRQLYSRPAASSYPKKTSKEREKSKNTRCRVEKQSIGAGPLGGKSSVPATERYKDREP